MWEDSQEAEEKGVPTSTRRGIYILSFPARANPDVVVLESPSWLMGCVASAILFSLLPQPATLSIYGRCVGQGIVSVKLDLKYN